MVITAWFSLFLCVFANLVSAISGIGIPLIFISQIIGGVAMAGGRIYICTASAFIAFFGLEFLSVFAIQNTLLSANSLIAGLLLLLPQIIGLGIYWRKMKNPPAISA